MKDIIKTFAILAAFFLMSTATTKDYIAFPCEAPLQSYLNLDNSSTSNVIGSHVDSIFIQTRKDSAWDEKTSNLCSILKDSCQITGRKFIILDTTSDASKWDTYYGKIIHVRQCP